MRVSLVATVLNEYGSLPAWTASLSRQTRLPDDCIIADGGSTDGTLEYLDSWKPAFPLTILRCPGTTISAGRNAAIERASGSIIAVTDAGTVAWTDWLEQLVGELQRDPDIDVVAGFFEPRPARRLWACALAAATLPDAAEIDPGTFLPSSRSFAFRRSWFEAGFRYPEWLDYCEDIVFDLQLRRAGARQVFARDAIVSFEPRSGPEAFARQYFRYARGDGKAGLFTHRHAIRYLSYALALTGLIVRPWLTLGAGFPLGLAYLRGPLRRYVGRLREDRLSPAPLVVAALLIAFQRALGDIAKMAGYPVGIAWRIRRDRSFRLWTSGWASRSRDGHLPRV
jgi:glycosyltransferase involved in cell wall biosynthesis